MINLRYHIVSLVAVFLALGVGIIVGSTVIDQTLVERLQAQTNGLRNRQSQLRADNDALSKQLGFWGRFGSTIVPPLVRGKLKGESVTLVVWAGSDGTVLDGVASALEEAGAGKPARVELTARWNLAGENDRRDLLDVIGGGAQPDAKIFETAGRAIGQRLAVRADTRASSDLLRRLDRAGFVRLADVSGTLFPAPRTLVVVVPSGKQEAGTDQAGLVVPLVRALIGVHPVAVAEGLSSSESLAEKIRGDGSLNTRVCTVDHIDTAPGRLSLVWALRQLLDGGEALHFGVRRGATGVAPDLGT
jgi:hypothetical protein